MSVSKKETWIAYFFILNFWESFTEISIRIFEGAAAAVNLRYRGRTLSLNEDILHLSDFPAIIIYLRDSYSFRKWNPAAILINFMTSSFTSFSFSRTFRFDFRQGCDVTYNSETHHHCHSIWALLMFSDVLAYPRLPSLLPPRLCHFIQCV